VNFVQLEIGEIVRYLPDKKTKYWLFFKSKGSRNFVFVVVVAR